MQYQTHKDFLINHILKDTNKSIKILEVFCGSGNRYKIIKDLGYNNYIGIDDDPKNITNCKSLYGNKGKFIYCENISEFIANNKFDIIFCIGPCRMHSLSNAIRSAKCKVFYSIARCVKDHHDKVCLLHRKLSEYTNFSWKIYDSQDRCTIVGVNYLALEYTNSKYLILKDVCRGIVDNMIEQDFLIEILSFIVEKYTYCNKIGCITKVDDATYVINKDFNIIVPLVDNFEIELDNKEIGKHVLDKGDIILLNKLNYTVNDKCLQISYQI